MPNTMIYKEASNCDKWKWGKYKYFFMLLVNPFETWK